MRLAILAACQFFLFTVVVACRAAEQPPGAENGAEAAWLSEKRELVAGPFLPKLSRLGASDEAGISQLKIRITELSPAGGTAQITIDDRDHDYNEFGDSVTEAVDSGSLDAQLHHIDFADETGEGRMLFSIQFVDGTLSNRLYLVLSPGPITEDRLLVMAGEADLPALPEFLAKRRQQGYPFDDVSFEHVIPLWTRGGQSVLQVLPRTSGVNLQSPKYYVSEHERHTSVQIHGKLNGRIVLGFDPNELSYTPIGDNSMSTLVGYAYYPFDLRHHPIKDPTDRERTIFDLVPLDDPVHPRMRQRPEDSATRYAIVLSPEADGADRFLVSESGRLTRILPLCDTERRTFLQQSLQLANSPVEKELLQRARMLETGGFHAAVQNGHVTDITLRGDAAMPETLGIVAQFPNLKTLSVTGCRAPEAQEHLKQIGQLTNLENLGFYVTPVSDSILPEIAKLQKLRYLRIYDEVPRDTAPEDVPHVTDEGLKSLARLPELAHLELYGPGVTDAGLASFAALTTLDRLHLYRTAVTYPGLIDFLKTASIREIEFNHWQPADGAPSSYETLSFALDRTTMSASLNGDLANDETFTQLCDLEDLKSVSIGARHLSDDALEALVSLKELESFRVSNNDDITVAGVVTLAELPQLTKLDLWDCNAIGDDAIDTLSTFSNLLELQLGETKVSNDGLARLRQKLPDCKILPE